MTKVPLTETSRCVTGILEHLGHGMFGRVQGFGFVRKTYSTIHSYTLGVATGQKRGPRRRTGLPARRAAVADEQLRATPRPPRAAAGPGGARGPGRAEERPRLSCPRRATAAVARGAGLVGDA